MHQIIGNKGRIYRLGSFNTRLFLNDDLSTPQIVFNKETASYPASKSSAKCEEG